MALRKKTPPQDPPSERQLKKCDMPGTAPNQTNGFPDNFGAFLGHSG